MPDRKVKKTADPNTEAKIKTAARTIFHTKGFAAARTRDIAEEAQINLALLNYYFGSKEKLFQLIMFETLSEFFKNMGAVFNDETTTLENKIQLIAEKYIDMLIAEPEIPFFIMGEIRSHGPELVEKLPSANAILQSVFFKQYKEAINKRKITELNPLHFLMNIMGLVVFPFVNSTMLKKVGKLKDKQFNMLMEERKKLIPIWMNAMLYAK